MFFLIEYHRKRGKLVSFKEFDDSERIEAETERLDLELRLNSMKKEYEVVILEAANKKALKRTHRRYFETPEQLVRSAQRDLNAKK